MLLVWCECRSGRSERERESIPFRAAAPQRELLKVAGECVRVHLAIVFHRPRSVPTRIRGESHRGYAARTARSHPRNMYMGMYCWYVCAWASACATAAPSASVTACGTDLDQNTSENWHSCHLLGGRQAAVLQPQAHGGIHEHQLVDVQVGVRVQIAPQMRLPHAPTRQRLNLHTHRDRDRDRLWRAASATDTASRSDR
jgi:hypothetical protein